MCDPDFKGVAVGFFDGVHLGHRAILESADVALTFRRHPLSVIAPERAPRLIMPVEARLAAIGECGVETVALEFDAATAALSPEEFADLHFVRRFRRPAAAIRVFCGENWRFGRGGAGDAALLRRLGFDVAVVPYTIYKGGPVSSSRIREALEGGLVEDANAMLGRRFRAEGRVMPGKKEGRRLGRPTLNLDMSGLELRLPLGVYAVHACGELAIANYGLAPTFGERAWERPVLEVHFSGAAPVVAQSPGPVAVEFERFVRGERKFGSVEELARQIEADCAMVFSPLAQKAAM